MGRRLRTRTGCLTCRKRRIKCGEEKPVCATCARLKLKCQWSEEVEASENTSSEHDLSATDDSVLIRRYPALLSHQTGQLANGFEPFESQTAFSLTILSITFYTLASNPMNVDSDNDHSPFLTLALQSPMVRPAFAAYSARLLATQDATFLPLAMRQYAKSVVNLREYVQEPTAKVHNLYFLAMTGLMGGYEFLDGNTQFALPHWSIMLYHASSVIRSQGWHHDPSLVIVVKMFTELGILGATGLSLFLPQLTSFMESIEWSVLETALEQKQPGRDYSYYLSPLAHGEIELYLVMLSVTTLARGRLSPAYRSEEAGDLDQRLTRLEHSMPPQYDRNLDPELLSFCITKRQFLISAIRTYLTKIMEPELCSNSVKIRSLTDHSLGCLHRLISTDSRAWVRRWPPPFEHRPFQAGVTPLYIWPLFVLACALYEPRDLHSMVVTINLLSPHLTAFTRESITKILQLIQERKQQNQWQCKAPSGATCTQYHDGLDLLLHPNGIFGPYLDQRSMEPEITGL